MLIKSCTLQLEKNSLIWNNILTTMPLFPILEKQLSKERPLNPNKEIVGFSA